MENTFRIRLKQQVIPAILYLTFLSGFFGSTLAYPKLSYLFAYRVFLALLFFLIFIDIILNGIELKSFLNFSTFFLIGWCAYSLLSFLWAQDIKSAVRDQVFLTINIFVILIFMYYSKYLRWDVFESIILISFIIHLAVGYFEVITDKHLWTSKVPLYNLHRTPSTFFTNPNDFATYLVLYLPFILAIAVNKKNNNFFRKWAAFLGTVLAIPLLILTTSRANYIGFLITLIIYFLLTDKDLKKSLLQYGAILLIFLMLIIGFRLDFGAFNKAVEMIKIQISSLADFSQTSLSSNVRRELLIVYGLSFLYDYLFFGVGSGNSRVLMEKVKQYTVNIELHNWFLDVLVCYGAVIFILYLVWIFYLLYNFFKMRKKNSALSMTAVSLMSSISAFFISSVSSSKMIEMRVMWFIFALSLFVLAKSKEEKGES
ncbi:hypothetical protein Calkro_1458 [Caldicellulosiruptor kronotskyensis 2002]|uniref:O-antigen ligase-related domain-containing protein n=1 Tax=Caldicellulosiruptor kronotskyensis (strain DSM 18902 / VKM B-2412 / 2002) TaxID=632348 RepID=E4SC79_CALK2|nr:O-antigen ligase family protein [Caldicellulosiruptor kronotskyensis]ADQ46314.1 hypothetical protein Calkro_1458 [Caldicellulosiruptor kronotskyensis 2002]